MGRTLLLVFFLAACPGPERPEEVSPPEAPPSLMPPLSGSGGVVDPNLCYRVAVLEKEQLQGTPHADLDPLRFKQTCEDRIRGKAGRGWRSFYECVDRIKEFSRVCVPVARREE